MFVHSWFPYKRIPYVSTSTYTNVFTMQHVCWHLLIVIVFPGRQTFLLSNSMYNNFSTRLSWCAAHLYCCMRRINWKPFKTAGFFLSFARNLNLKVIKFELKVGNLSSARFFPNMSPSLSSEIIVIVLKTWCFKICFQRCCRMFQNLNC